MVKRALTLLTSILFALPLLMPFNIYASATHQVQTDYLSTVSSEWTNSMVFTSYCEGTNASTASCVLTVNITKSPKNYFGTVTIHGYDSSGTKWINYGDIFVSAGTGVYNYNFYQNGIKEISRVEVYSTNLIQPSSTVDLSQIISLLTSINNYEQQIKNSVDNVETNQLTTITEIRNVINELVDTNGYLETLTNLRQWNFPLESMSFNIYLLTNNFKINDIIQYNYWIYPVFEINKGDNIFGFNSSNNSVYRFILYIDKNIYTGRIPQQFSFSEGTMIDWGTLDVFRYNSSQGYIVFIDYQNNTGSNINPYLVYKDELNTNKANIICFYAGLKDNKRISTDFALIFGLKNELLDNLNLIANGTTASQSAADSSQSANEQLQTDSNTLFQQENGFKSDMNNAMQNVNTTFRLQDMGTKFVSSAQWVRTQYEQLTNNTPFASLIMFSLITGLALILLGKVYK